MNIYYCQLHGQYQPSGGIVSMCPQCAQQNYQYGQTAGGVITPPEILRHRELMAMLRAILEQLKSKEPK